MRLNKEIRFGVVVVIWFSLWIYFGGFIVPKLTTSEEEASFTSTIGYIFLTFTYIVITCLINEITKKPVKYRFKINRLKNNKSPIYRVRNVVDGVSVERFSVQYTDLDLYAILPFSVLFLEQSYVSDGIFEFSVKVDSIDSPSVLWEEEYDKVNKIKLEKTAKKDKEQSKLKTLNKEFDENYK